MKLAGRKNDKNKFNHLAASLLQRSEHGLSDEQNILLCEAFFTYGTSSSVEGDYVERIGYLQKAKMILKRTQDPSLFDSQQLRIDRFGFFLIYIKV